MSKYLLFLYVISFSVVKAQLLPSIGLSAEPAPTATLCKAPLYLGSFYTSGLAKGNYAPDFKLYGLNGDSLDLSHELAAGKPVLLIAGSLTCPVFRNKVSIINSLVTTYGSAVKIFLIYTLEAHPTDTSVYFGKINITSANQNAGILFPQAATYAQRKHLADTMSSWINLNIPVFIDGPCNEWWSAFGPAPNNSYIIAPNGQILSKHGWFDRSPDRIFCDLDSILSVNSGSCLTANNSGSFTINVKKSNVSGNPGDLLYDYVDIVNSGTAAVTVIAKKIQKNLPPGWQTAFCADICYSTSEDSVGFVVPAKDTIAFSLDFFTDMNPDSGSVKVGFKNLYKDNNKYELRLRANTMGLTVGTETNDQGKTFNIFPNPASDIVFIHSTGENFQIRIYDVQGQLVITSNASQINVETLKTGLYSIIYDSSSFTARKNIFISR